MRKLFKTFLYLILGILAFVLGYFAVATICSKWPSRPAGITEKPVLKLYILSNGVHTDLVMPVHSEWHNWEKEFSYNHTVGGDTTLTYIGVGWGDKGFYLNTPTWADLTLKVAFEAMFGLSTTAVHATFHHLPDSGEYCKPIYVTPTQYQSLIAYILQSLQYNPDGHTRFIETNAVYGQQDAFYEAVGSYHMFHTCNTWTNNGLKAAGQKACLWTPFQSGILNQYTP